MKRTIQKVLTELQKDKPDLSYIRGLLEGLVEESDIVYNTSTINSTSNFPIAGVVPLTISKSDEEQIPAHLRPGPIGNLNT